MCERPVVIEIAGLAGAGKSTLTAVLESSGKFIRGEEFATTTWQQRLCYARYCLANGVRSLPAFWRVGRAFEPLSAEEVKKILYLRGWHEVFDRQKKRSDLPLVLDQGPVFYLATLLAFGPASLRGDGAGLFFDRTVARWAEVLDGVVWLDAPDEVLLARIHERSSPHVVKGASRKEAKAFLDAYRTAYDRTLRALGKESPIERLAFDTGVESSESIATRVAARLSWGEP